MQIEIIGSGGAMPTPRPGCQCRVCSEARQKGIPYSRCGPSLFVHGPDVLFDTPEDIRTALNHSTVRQVPACFYSHWHPDHVLGRRIFETLNADWFHWPPHPRHTDIYLPQQVATDFRKWLGSWEQMHYLEQLELVRLIELRDGDTVTLNGVTIRPFRLAEDYVYAFLLEGQGQRVLLAPDELNNWVPPADVRGLDLAVIPTGIFEFDPFSGERRIDAEHPVLKYEATFDETLEMVRQLDARQVVMVHIEEPDQLGYDDYRRLEDRLRAGGLNVRFGYDTLIIDL